MGKYIPQWLRVLGQMDAKAANAAGLILSLGAAIFLILAGVALLTAAWR